MSATLSPGVTAPPPDTEAAPGRKAGSLLLMPSVIVLLAWMIVPLVMTLWFSFQYYNLVSPETRGFAGIDTHLGQDGHQHLTEGLKALRRVPNVIDHELSVLAET